MRDPERINDFGKGVDDMQFLITYNNGATHLVDAADKYEAIEKKRRIILPGSAVSKTVTEKSAEADGVIPGRFDDPLNPTR